MATTMPITSLRNLFGHDRSISGFDQLPTGQRHARTSVGGSMMKMRRR
jgi:hypothetical protein